MTRRPDIVRRTQARKASLLPALLGLLLLPIASSTAAEPTRRGGTLKLAVEIDPHSLDAAQLYSNEEATLGFLIFNTLIEPNPGGGFSPALAESLPSTSPDGLTHTFRLRKGVKFSNGRELEAEDVVHTFERFFDPALVAPNASMFQVISGGAAFRQARTREAAAPEEVARHSGARWIEPLSVSGLRAVDRHTVEFRLDKPDLAFLHALTSPAGGIVPRAESRTLGPSFSQNPIGTGRYRLKEWFRGARIRLVRNPHHFRAESHDPGEVDILVNVDRATQAMMFERGELDFQYYISDPDFIRIQRDPALRSSLRIVTGAAPTFIFFNCELPPFTNRLVRLALNHAVDRNALVRVLANRCVPQSGPLALSVSGFNRGLPAYPYDPAKARTLLAEAGFPNGFETTLWANRAAPESMKIALFVQESLRNIGVTIQLKEVAFSALLDLAGRRKTVAMATWDWGAAFDDPKDTLDSLLNGDNISDEGCMNVAFYSNAQVQQRFRDAVAETDAPRRLEIYRQIERQVVDDAPWLFLVQFNTEMRCQPWLKGLQVRGFWPPARLDNGWLDR